MKLTLLASAGIAVLAIGYAATGHAAATAGVPKCPARAPKFESTLGSSKQFVKPKAQAIRLCRYYKSNWATGQTLWEQRLIADGPTITRLTHAFNQLQEPPRGIFCVKDDGSEMQLIFGYAGGKVERVVVKLSGCRFASNGKSVRSTTAWLHKRLLALANQK
jgi:hypothetical protein